MGNVAKTVAGTGAVIAAVAGAVGLLFQVDPRLAPCLGGRSATFTGSPVFPNYPYHQYLKDLGEGGSSISRGPNPSGAEIRYSYVADDLRGETLVLRETLVRLAKDGTIAAADTNPLDANDLAPAATLVPTQCSQTSGGDIFVYVPHTRGRFEIVLELFLGERLDTRIALGETPPFDG